MNLATLENARVALRESVRLAPGQSLLIVEDGTLGAVLGDAFEAASWALDATPLRLRYAAGRPLPMREFGLFAAASLKSGPYLPALVTQAIRGADATVILNSDMSIMFDDGLRDVLRDGTARIAWGPYLTEEFFLRMLPGTAQEARGLRDLTLRVGGVLGKAREVALRSPRGTDLRMSLGNHRVNCGTGMTDPGNGYGGLEIWPGGQASTVPNAGTASGTLVVDRSVNAPEFHALLDPITLTVEDGYVVDIAGGVEAGRLRRWLATLDDREAYHLTELGVGTNRRCKFAGVSAPCEDTHAFGCVSLALGADVHLGGDTRSPCHVDLTMHGTTLEVDGSLLVDDGDVVLY